MYKPRNTIQRQLVLDAVRANHSHPTAEDIYRQVAKEHPHISRGTVYRNLGKLAQAGEIRRVTNLNAADRFDFALQPHYHFHCRGCDGVFDVPMGKAEALPDQEAGKGFIFERCERIYTGLCPGCNAQNSRS